LFNLLLSFLKLLLTQMTMHLQLKYFGILFGDLGHEVIHLITGVIDGHIVVPVSRVIDAACGDLVNRMIRRSHSWLMDAAIHNGSLRHVRSRGHTASGWAMDLLGLDHGIGITSGRHLQGVAAEYCQ
jgi:hypothetical protein